LFIAICACQSIRRSRNQPIAIIKPTNNAAHIKAKAALLARSPAALFVWRARRIVRLWAASAAARAPHSSPA
jgi:hypothetical protein